MDTHEEVSGGRSAASAANDKPGAQERLLGIIASATDAEPARATATRRAMLADLLSHPGSIVAPTHLDEPFGRIRTASDGRAAFDALA